MEQRVHSTGLTRTRFAEDRDCITLQIKTKLDRIVLCFYAEFTYLQNIFFIVLVATFVHLRPVTINLKQQSNPCSPCDRINCSALNNTTVRRGLWPENLIIMEKCDDLNQEINKNGILVTYLGLAKKHLGSYKVS